MKSLQELKLSPYKENNAWTGCRNLIQCRKIKHLLQEQLFLGLVLFLKDTCTAAIHWCNLATLSRATSELIEVENLTYATKVDWWAGIFFNKTLNIDNIGIVFNCLGKDISVSLPCFLKWCQKCVSYCSLAFLVHAGTKISTNTCTWMHISHMNHDRLWTQAGGDNLISIWNMKNKSAGSTLGDNFIE